MADALSTIYDMLESGTVRGTLYRSPNDGSIIAQPQPFPELEEIADCVLAPLWYFDPLPRARMFANRAFGFDLPETGVWAPPDKGPKLLHPLKSTRALTHGNKGRPPSNIRPPPLRPITPEAVRALLGDIRRVAHAYNVPLKEIEHRIMQHFGCPISTARETWSEYRKEVSR
jgi:hypothetical protein